MNSRRLRDTSGDVGVQAHWATVEALFHDVLEQPAASRSKYLREACSDASLRAEVETLLAAHVNRGVLDQLLDDVMLPMLPRREAVSDTTLCLPANSRYRILDRVGGGGMGVVYRARDERLDRDVALKFLSPHLSSDDVAKRRFLVEARAAAAIEHPNICTVHEIADTEDGRLYIVMACYEGETLDRRIARGPLLLEDALRIAGDIARGLGKAHDRGIVHRDIKPANVMITGDGVVKILDFGIAKLTDVAVTQTVGVLGTVAYMSPEQAFGETVDHRTDLWSLGVVLYEMLTGQRPFRGPGEQAVLVAALSAEPESVLRLRSDVSAEVDSLIRRAMAKRAQDRFANAAELLTALAACAPGSDAVAGGGRARIDRAAPTDGEGWGAGEPREPTITRGGERRQVTVVAVTIDGHEALFERLAPENAEDILRQLRDAADAVAAAAGGIVNRFTGDELVLLFGVPVAHEEDTLRAVRSSLALRERVAAIASTLNARLAAGLHVRAGIHVGQVVAQELRTGDRRFRITGAPADVASRLASAAEADAVLLSPDARRLVAPFIRTEATGAVAMSGDADPMTAHRVIGASDVRSRLEGAALAGLTPFVGREQERAALAEQLGSACGGVGRVTVLLGEAGTGKSRLLYEVREMAAMRGMRVLVGRCDTNGGSMPFLPFIDAVQDAFGLIEGGTISERHEMVVAAVRGMGASLEGYLPLYLALLAIPSDVHPLPEQVRGEPFQAAILEALAALFSLGLRVRPTLVMLEDWHWADEASRVALHSLSEIVAEFPLMLMVTTRPDETATWGSAEHQRLMHLAPLDTAASATIAGAVLGADRVHPDLAARLHERTGGNPFFLEEVCEALREAGAVIVTDGEAAADATGVLHVPETVQGVLRTRMDRLQMDARELLRVASVIGREFTRGVLEDVAGSTGELTPTIEVLKHSGLVQQFGVVPEPVYRFKHALTQEVAYDSLLEHQRSALHARVGRAIEQRYSARLDEHGERLAHHFSRAEDWRQAVHYGLLSADRAIELSQNADALSTLDRVEVWVRHLPDDGDRRDLLADVLLRKERLSEMLGLRDRQLELVETLIALLARDGPSPRLAQVYLRQGDALTLLNRFEAADRSLSTALRIANERDDSQGERNALRSIAFLRSHEGRHADALEVIERVLALGRAAGDTRAEAGDLATLGNVLRALGQSERSLTVLSAALERMEVAWNPARYGYLLNVIAAVHRDLGNNDAALDFYRRTAEYMTVPTYASFTLPSVAFILLQQGRTDDALATYREAVELTRKSRYAEGAANANRSLGEVLLGLERPEEALPYLQDATRLYAQLQDRQNEVTMLRRLAGVYEQLQVPTEAYAAWLRLRVLHHDQVNDVGEAEAAEGMARAERQLPARADDVIAHYEEAIALAMRQRDRARELSVRNSLGIVYWQRQAYAEALRQYEAALRLCRDIGDTVHEGLILNSLAATLHKVKRWDEARTVLSDALRVTRLAGERQLQAHALALLGDVCLDSGRAAEARTHIDASLALRRELGDRRGEGWLLERLARVLGAEGMYAAAAAAISEGERAASETQDATLSTAFATLRSSVHPLHSPYQ